MTKDQELNYTLLRLAEMDLLDKYESYNPSPYATSLIDSFRFTETEEGHEFWYSLHEQINKEISQPTICISDSLKQETKHKTETSDSFVFLSFGVILTALALFFIINLLYL